MVRHTGKHDFSKRARTIQEQIPVLGALRLQTIAKAEQTFLLPLRQNFLDAPWEALRPVGPVKTFQVPRGFALLVACA